MQNQLIRLLNLTLLLSGLVFGLVACGSSDNTPKLIVSDKNISFSANIDGSTPAAQTISINVKNLNKTVYLGTYFDGSSLDNVTYDLYETPVPVTLYPKSPSSLGAGNHTDTVTIVACLDFNCDSHIAGSPTTINVNYSIIGTLGVSSTSLSFEHVISATPPANQSLNISASGLSWTATSDQAWLSLASNSGTGSSMVPVLINPTSLDPGTYTATITINSPDSGETIHVSVSLQVTEPALSTSLDSVSHDIVIGSTIPSDTVTLTITSGLTTNWEAISNTSWVTLNKSSGSTPDTITLNYDISGLAPGSHSANVTFNGSDTNSDLSITLPITLNIIAPEFVVDTTSLSFSGINGTPIEIQSVNLSINNDAMTSWSANSSANWIILSTNNGTTPESLSISIDPSIEPLASGNHTGTIELSGNSEGFPINTTININLNLTKPVLSFEQSNIVLGGVDGLDTNTQPIGFSINTGTNTYPWTATLDVGSENQWLTADTTSGNINSTIKSLNLGVDRTVITGGSYTGSIIVSAIVNGDVVTNSIPVTAHRAAHRLFVADNGIALSKTPLSSTLSHAVSVEENLGELVNWTASSDQAWLTATASGSTGENLVVTANPTGLATDTVHYATVSISSASLDIDNTETIRVGLWVGSTVSNSADSISLAASFIEPDPIRPYVYISSGTDVHIYNVYTASLVSTISNVASAASDITISTNGSTLWVSDATNFSIVPINLDTQAIGTPWSLASSPQVQRLIYARPNGKEIIMASDGYAYDALSSESKGAVFNSTTTPVFVISPNSQIFCRMGLCNDIKYSYLNGGVLDLLNQRVGGGCRDVAISADSSRLYTACGSPYEFRVYDLSAETMTHVQTLPGEAYPGNVEVATNGLIYGGIYPPGTGPEVWAYNFAGIEQANYSFDGWLLDNGLVISADSNRMIAITATSVLPGDTVHFRTVSP